MVPDHKNCQNKKKLRRRLYGIEENNKREAC